MASNLNSSRAIDLVNETCSDDLSAVIKEKIIDSLDKNCLKIEEISTYLTLQSTIGADQVKKLTETSKFEEFFQSCSRSLDDVVEAIAAPSTVTNPSLGKKSTANCLNLLFPSEAR